MEDDRKTGAGVSLSRSVRSPARSPGFSRGRSPSSIEANWYDFLYRRFQLPCVEVSEPIDIEGLRPGRRRRSTTAAPHRAASGRAAATRRRRRSLTTGNWSGCEPDPVYAGSLLERTGQHVGDRPRPVAEAHVWSWERCVRGDLRGLARYQEAETDQARRRRPSGAAGRRRVVASDRLAGLITDIGEVFRACSNRMPEFVNPRVRHRLPACSKGRSATARQVGTLDLSRAVAAPGGDRSRRRPRSTVLGRCPRVGGGVPGARGNPVECRHRRR